MSDIYEPGTFDPSNNIWRSIARVRQVLVDALNTELAPLDITAAQYVIIISLAAGDADSASNLCKSLPYDPGAMTRMLDRLEHRGLVRRTVRIDHRRAAALELTAEGKLLIPALRTSEAAVLNKHLRRFTKAEARQFESFLRRMLVNC